MLHLFTTKFSHPQYLKKETIITYVEKSKLMDIIGELLIIVSDDIYEILLKIILNLIKLSSIICKYNYVYYNVLIISLIILIIYIFLLNR